MTNYIIGLRLQIVGSQRDSNLSYLTVNMFIVCQSKIQINLTVSCVIGVVIHEVSFIQHM